MLVGSFPSLSQTGARAQGPDWSEPPQAGHCRAWRLLTPGPGQQSHYQVMSSLGGQTRPLLSNESAPCRVTCSQKTSLWPVPRGVQGKMLSPMEGSHGPCNDVQAPFSSSQFGNRFPRSKMQKFVILCEHNHALPSHRCCPHPFLTA